MRSGGAPLARWAGHLGAGVLGLLLYFAVVRAPRPSYKRMLAAAFGAVALLGSALCAAGLQGVHRWIFISGVRLHPSQLMMPALLVLLTSQLRRSPALISMLLVAVQVLHFLQPDAGQASAVAVACLVVCLVRRTGVVSRLCLAVSLLTAAATWTRSDPLAPAPFVEDIVTRAFSNTWWFGCVSLLSLAAASLAPMIFVGRISGAATGGAGLVLSVYLAAAMLVTAFGPFPVPLLGFGASSVLGAFLGLAALHQTERSEAEGGISAVSESVPGPVIGAAVNRGFGRLGQPPEGGVNL